MIYGNNGDSFSLVTNGSGYFQLRRHGLGTVCPYMGANWPQKDGMQCGDHCACFHRYHDGDNLEVHLCCCSPPVVIRIKYVA